MIRVNSSSFAFSVALLVQCGGATKSEPPLPAATSQPEPVAVETAEPAEEPVSEVPPEPEAPPEKPSKPAPTCPELPKKTCQVTNGCAWHDINKCIAE